MADDETVSRWDFEPREGWQRAYLNLRSRIKRARNAGWISEHMWALQRSDPRVLLSIHKNAAQMFLRMMLEEECMTFKYGAAVDDLPDPDRPAYYMDMPWQADFSILMPVNPSKGNANFEDTIKDAERDAAIRTLNKTLASLSEFRGGLGSLQDCAIVNAIVRIVEQQKRDVK